MSSSVTPRRRLEHASFCIPFPCFTPPSFGMFTVESVGHISLGHPPSQPWPGTLCSSLPGSEMRPHTLFQVTAPRPRAGTRILCTHSPACCAHTALPLLQPRPWECWTAPQGPFLLTGTGSALLIPLEPYWGFPCSSRSLRPAQPLLNSTFVMVLLCKISMGRARAPYSLFYLGFILIKSGQNSD